jgi:hypothetical protein
MSAICITNYFVEKGEALVVSFSVYGFLRSFVSEKCINTFKEFIYNAINFKMVSNITH